MTEVTQAFTVHDVSGETYTATVYSHVDGKMIVEQREKQKGFLVKLPHGNELHVRNEAELERLGFDRPAHLVDEDGENVPRTRMAPVRKGRSADDAA